MPIVRDFVLARCWAPFSSFIPRPYFFFSNDTAPPELYTLSLHDALPILELGYLELNEQSIALVQRLGLIFATVTWVKIGKHTSELQSLRHLVCRLLLEKKKPMIHIYLLRFPRLV